MREKPLPPSLLGFPNIHPVCLASLHHLQPQGGRMEWERFLAVGENGIADPSICSAFAGLKEFSQFLIQTHSHPCQDEGITQALQMETTMPQGGKVTSLEPNTWETWAGFQPDPSNSRVVNQLQVGISQLGPHA